MHPAITGPTRARSPRRRRRLLLTVVVLVLAAAPTAVLATHRFGDVANTNPFHADIDELTGAGITGGCRAGAYCPKRSVTRDQMAGFLTRGLGRTHYGEGVNELIVPPDQPAAYALVASVPVEAGGLPGRTGVAQLDATVTAFTSDPAACPCEVEFFVVPDSELDPESDFHTSLTHYMDLGGTPTEVTGDTNATGSITWAREVATGAVETYHLVAGTADPDAAIVVYGSMASTYSPFGSTQEIGFLGAEQSAGGSPLPERLRPPADEVRAALADR